MKIQRGKWFGYVPCQVTDFISGLCKNDSTSSSRQRLLLREIEARVLLSASPIDFDLIDGDVDVDQENFHDPEVGIDLGLQQIETLFLEESRLDQSVKKNLIFIDETLDNLEELIAGIDFDENEVVGIGVEDNLETITRLVASFSDLDSIHFVTHGNEGQIQLGSTILSHDSYAEGREWVSKWKSSLAEGADILFYGCNVAGVESGQELLQSLASDTGAEVAASVDLTGHQSLGGNWDLEYQIGEIEAAVFVGENSPYQWIGSLETIVVTTNADENDGDTSSIAALLASSGGTGISLREAVLAAENTAGSDVIQIGSGTYILGEMIVTSEIEIVGQGYSETTIDANRAERIFQVSGFGSLTLSEVALTNSDLREQDVNDIGVVIKVDENADLTLNHVRVHDLPMFVGTATSAIATDGVLTIQSSIFEDLSSDGSGGAIYSTNDISINDSFFSSNFSRDFGGAIYLAGQEGEGTTLSISSTEFNSNTGLDGGGALYLRNVLSLIDDSEFRLNISNSGDGGAINQGGSVTETSIWTNTTIRNSRGESGGGLYLDGNQYEFDNLFFFANFGTTAGGGIYADSANLQVTNSRLDRNTSNGFGGGIFATGSDLNLDRVGFFEGSSSDGGGAIRATSGTTGVWENITISGNSSGEIGGGLYLSSTGAISIRHATVANNTADSGGAGIHIDPGTSNLSISYSIVSGNALDSGVASDVSGNVSSGGYNIVLSTTGSTGWIGDDLLGVDPGLLPLAHNGRETESHGLREDSVAIDAATGSTQEFDARGVQRVNPDIGAVEYFPTLSIPQGSLLQLDPIDSTDTENMGMKVEFLLDQITVTSADDLSPGIAIYDIESPGGIWEFSIDNGLTWDDVEISSSGFALVLGVTDRLRFVPNNPNGGPAKVRFKAWDPATGSSGYQRHIVDSFSSGTTEESGVILQSFLDINNAPSFLSSDGSNRGMVSGNIAEPVAPTITIFDFESGNANEGNGDFSGSSVQLVINSGGTNHDVFEFLNGNGLANVGESILKNGVEIASFVTDVSGELFIRFSGAAGEVVTSDDVNSILRQIGYRNTAHTASGELEVEWTFNEGESQGNSLQTATQTTSISLSPTAIVVTTFVDEDDGDTTSVSALLASNGGTGVSLREAVLAAENTAGKDVIILAAGLYEFDLAASLAVTTEINVIGRGLDESFIDGNALARIWNVGSGGDLSLSRVAMTNSGLNSSLDSDDFSGSVVRVQSGGQLELNHARVYDIERVAGRNFGAIQVSSGTLSVDQSIFENNSNTIAGGAIRLIGNGQISNSIFRNNHSDNDGGAISARSHDPGQYSVSIDGSEFIGNQGQDGGAVSAYESQLLINDSLFRGNSADNGGAFHMIRNQAAPSVLSSTVIENNIASNLGGGIYANSFVFHADNLAVRGNHSGDDGGGVYLTAGHYYFDGSVVESNTADGNGGGITTFYNGRLFLDQVSVVNNSATSSGGGIYTASSIGTWTNLTVSGNHASIGGGIAKSSQQNAINISHATITNNTADSEAAGVFIHEDGGNFNLSYSIVSGNFLSNGSASDVHGEVTSGGYNLIESTDGSTGWIASDILGVDPGLLALADNGGTVRTHGLSFDSAAIDAAAGSTLDVDARGFQRVAPDIGAVEFFQNPVIESNQLIQLDPISSSENDPAGSLIGSLLAQTNVEDTPGAPEGIAVVDLVSPGGTWQFSTDDGSTWTDIGAVSSASALLLGVSDRIRFVPNSPTNGPARFKFRAWDQTTGSRGDRIDLDSASLIGISEETASAIQTFSDLPNAPVVYDLEGADSTFFSGRSAEALDPTIAVFDPELSSLNGGEGDFSGASVRLVRSTGNDHSDQFEFLDGNGLIRNGNTIEKNGQPIASFDSDIEGELTIEFSSAHGEIATTDDVNNVLRQIGYRNADPTGSGSIEIDWEFNEGTVNGSNLSSVAESTTIQLHPTAITVTTLVDEVDGDTSSVSALLGNSGGTGISLREAILAANASPGLNTILLPSGTYDLTLAGTLEDLGQTGDLDITDSLRIEGQGAGETIIQGNSIDRIFDVRAGASSITSLTVTGGHSEESGGGIRVAESGELRIEDSEIHGNEVVGQDGGGGISSEGALEVASSSIYQNSSTSDGGGMLISGGTATIDSTWLHGNQTDGSGGAIFVAGGDLDLNGVTVSGNEAFNGGGGIAVSGDGSGVWRNLTVSGNTTNGEGGGIDFQGTGEFQLIGGTVANNVSGSAGAGVTTSPSSNFSIQNSIIADNLLSSGASSDIQGDFRSEGNNLLETVSGIGAVSSDTIGVDPGLLELNQNGGAVPVHGLRSDSEAIGGARSTEEDRDARGVLRQNGADVGAFEFNVAPALSDTGSVSLTSISPDESDPNGNTIQEILDSAGGGLVSDSDYGNEVGIAIESLRGDGQWQFSLDGGQTWVDISNVDTSNALLLAGEDRIRFVPDPGGSHAPQFTFRAWDGTIGQSGELESLESVGGFSSFSSNNRIATLQLIGDNIAPGFHDVGEVVTPVVSGHDGVVIDPDVYVSDSHLDNLNNGMGNYDGSVLTLVRMGGGNVADSFGFLNSGEISLVGTNLVKNGIVIASFDLTSSPGSLAIAFSSAAGEIPTTEDVTEILRSITYSNSVDPTPSSISLLWTFNDGQAPSSLEATAESTVSIQANSVPYSTGRTIEVLEDEPYVFRLEDFGYQDANNDPFHQVRVSPNGFDGQLILNGNRITGGSTIATREDIEEGRLVYWADPDESGDSYFSIYYRVADQTSEQPFASVLEINVVSVDDEAVFNDNPVGTAFLDIGPGDNRPIDVRTTDDGKTYVLFDDDFNNVNKIARLNEDGTFDLTFGGGDGIIELGSSGGRGHSIAIQADGKLVFSGSQENGLISTLRFNSDGTFDTSFADGGIAEIEFPDFLRDVISTNIDVEGRILVSGTVDDSQGRTFGVLRLNSDGTLDSSFGSEGKVVLPVSLSVFRLTDAELLSNGGIALIGYQNGQAGIVMTMLNEDGSLDTNFDNDGILNYPISGQTFPKKVLQQSDGKILVVSSNYDGSRTGIHVVRFNLDGSIDEDYGTNGIASLYPASGDSYSPNDAALQDDDQLVLYVNTVGGAHGGGGQVYRFSTAGYRDLTFGGGDGRFDIEDGANDQRSAPVGTLTHDGDIVTVVEAGSWDGVVSRYNGLGAPDPTVTGEQNLAHLASLTEGGAAVLLDPDVSIRDTELDVLNSGLGNYHGASVRLERSTGANSNDVFSFLNGNGYVLSGNRITKSGVEIASFDTSSIAGQLTILFSDSHGEIPNSVDVEEIFRRITFQITGGNPPTSGQIVWVYNGGVEAGNSGEETVGLTDFEVTGIIQDPPTATGNSIGFREGENYVISYHDLGFMDPDGDSFVHLTITELPTSGVLFLRGEPVTQNQQILLDSLQNGHLVYEPNQDLFGTNVDDFQFTVNDGTLDSVHPGTIQFSIEGVNDSPRFSDSYGTGVAISSNLDTIFTADSFVQDDGRVVSIGRSSETSELRIVRFNNDGSIDPSFGSEGGFSIPDFSGSLDVSSITSQEDGMFLVAGRMEEGGDEYSFVMRLRPDGTLDESFGSGEGIVQWIIGDGTNEVANDVLVLPDGGILVTGEFAESETSGEINHDIYVRRLHGDGSVDLSFGDQGSTTLDFFQDSLDSAGQLIPNSDGTFFVVGSNRDGLVVAKYLVDGTLDSSFDGDGIREVVLDDLSSTDRSAAVQADGKIVIATTVGDDAGVIRLRTDGSLDSSFGGTGVVLIDHLSGIEQGRSIQVQPDGQIVVGFDSQLPGGNQEFGIARLNPDGSLDDRFGTGGLVVEAIGSGSASMTNVMIGPGGEIVATGSADNGEGVGFATLRLNPDGSVDQTFGGTNETEQPAYFVTGGPSVLLDPNASIVDSELDGLNGGQGNYSGTRLTVGRNGAVNSNDQFSFEDGNGISLVGGSLIKDSQVIATFDTSTPGELSLEFTDASGSIPTTEDVTNILRQISFRTDEALQSSPIEMEWAFFDGSGGNQESGESVGTRVTTVEILPENSGPIDIRISETQSSGLEINNDGGNSNYLLASDGGRILGGQSEFTFETRVSIEPNEPNAVLVSYATETEFNELMIRTNNGDLLLSIGGESRTIDAFDFSSLADGDSHTISVSWTNSDGSWKVFVDGEVVAIGSGLQSGYTLQNDGVLVFGQEQDSMGGSFQHTETFHGSLYEIRFFEDVRSESQIRSNYHTLSSNDETGLIAHWDFDNFGADGIIYDTVGDETLELRNYAGTGFSESTPTLEMHVSEDSAAGEFVARLEAQDFERSHRIQRLLDGNPDLRYSHRTGKFYQISSAETDFTTASFSASSSLLNGVSGELLTIEDGVENQVIHELMNHYGRPVWLSATDQTTQDQWRWVRDGQESDIFWRGDGSGHTEQGSYSNWSDARPSDNGNRHAFFDSSDGRWHDTSDSDALSSIVQWDADEVLDATDAISYSIISQTVSGAFEIDEDSGEIRVADGNLLDYSTHSVHQIVIRATDSEGEFYDQSFEIRIDESEVQATQVEGLSTGVHLNQNGGNDVYLIADNGGDILGGLSEFTIEITFSAETLEYRNTFFSYASPDGSTNELLIFVGEDGNLLLVMEGPVHADLGVNVADLNDGQVRTVSVSWDNSDGEVRSYLDGEFIRSETGLRVGQTIAGNGELVIGHDQDSVGGGFEYNNNFEGAFYDIRVWDDVRSDREIALNYQNQIPLHSVPDNLLANWQMDGITSSDQIVDIVNGNQLNVRRATGPGFVEGSISASLSTSESTVDGATVGNVTPRGSIYVEEISENGLFNDYAGPESFERLIEGEDFGHWTVSQGSVDLSRSFFEGSPLGGNSIDLAGSENGGIEQVLNTQAGRSYQVTFAVSGNWQVDSDSKQLQVSASGQSEQMAVSRPDDWATDNMQWQHRSFTFTADSSTSVLEFLGIGDGSTGHGPVIADVQVFEIPQAITNVLNEDPSLQYNAETNKFYRYVTETVTWQEAFEAARNSQVNGVSGSLVRVESAGENQFLQNQIDVGTDVWLGGSDAQSEGIWRWQGETHQGESFWDQSSGGVEGRYSNWDPSQPDSISDDDDFTLLRGRDGHWADAGSSDTAGYFVEWEASEVIGSHTFSLTDDAGGRFGIDESSGDIFVRDASLLDYETADSHDIEIQITDAAGSNFVQTLTIQLTDQGGEPAVQIPEEQAVNEGEPIEFSSDNGNAITVSDQGGEDLELRVLVETTDGTMQLGSTDGITILEGEDGSSRILIEGTESEINAALDGLVFQPNEGFQGEAEISVTTSATADLSAHYNFEDSTAGDQSPGSEHSGNYRGAASTESSSDSQRGEVLSLDGSAGTDVEIPGTFDSPESLTIAAWVNSNEQDSDIISIGDGIRLRFDRSGSEDGVSVEISDASGTRVLHSGENLAGTGWRHVAVTVDPSNGEATLFVDGVQVSETSIQGPIDYGSGNSYIGSNGGDSGFFNGQIDDVQVFSRSLTPGEIHAIATDRYESTEVVSVNYESVNEAPTFETGQGYVSGSAFELNLQNPKLLIQSDGKYLQVGRLASSESTEFVIVRYESTGEIDTSFGNGGYAVVVDPGNDESLTSAILQSDGKILVGGSVYVDGSETMFLQRYSPDGSIDESFGSGGVVVMESSASFHNANSIALQDDGRILVVGEASASRTGVIRLNTDGSVDSTFGGGDGISTHLFGGMTSSGSSIKVGSDGSIFIAGDHQFFGFSQSILAKFNGDGDLDSSFGGGVGYILEPNGLVFSGSDVFPQEDGTLLLVSTPNGFVSGRDFSVSKYDSNGNLDTSFGVSGTVEFSEFSEDNVVHSAAIQFDGKLLIGSVRQVGGSEEFLIVRYNTDGTLDSSFGAGVGYVTYSIQDGTQRPHGLNQLEDGRILVSGAGNGDSHLIRLNEDGSLDQSFGSIDTVAQSVSYEEDGDPVFLDREISLSDSELDARNGGAGNYAGAEVSLGRQGGANQDDHFHFENLVDISLSSGQLIKNGEVIAIFDDSVPGELSMVFTDENGEIPTSDDVKNILQNIRYSNSNSNPPDAVEITWTVDDGNDGSQGTGGRLSTTGTTTVQISSVNDAPSVTGTMPSDIDAVEDSASMVHFPLLTLVDPDAGLESLVVTLQSSGDSILVAESDGAVSVSGSGSSTLVLEGTLDQLNTFLNTPDLIHYSHNQEHFSGDSVDSITVTVADQSGEGERVSVGVMNVDIQEVNDAPVAEDDSFEVNQAETLVLGLQDLLRNDRDPDDSMHLATFVQLPAHGTVTMNSDGEILYTPDPGFFGTDHFFYVTDDGEAVSSPARVSVQVNPVGLGDSNGNDGIDTSARNEESVVERNESTSEAAEEMEESRQLIDDFSEPTAQTENADSSLNPEEFYGLVDSESQTNQEARRHSSEKAMESRESQEKSGDKESSSGSLSGSGIQKVFAPSLGLAREALELINNSTEIPQDLQNSIQKLDDAGELEFSAFFDATMFAAEDDSNSESDSNMEVKERLFENSVVTGSLVAAAGYVLWTLRGGVLMASLLSSLPSWKFFDPLPILDNFRSGLGKGTDAGESLENLLEDELSDRSE